MKIDIGGGIHPKPGFLNMDYADLPTTDIRTDLNKPFPLKDESVDVYYSRHCLEHLTVEPYKIFQEIHRTLKPGGVVELILPYGIMALSLWHVKHIRYGDLVAYTNSYASGSGEAYNYPKFKLLEDRIYFRTECMRFMKPLGWLFQRIADRVPHLYNRYWFGLFPADELRVTLQKETI